MGETLSGFSKLLFAHVAGAAGAMGEKQNCFVNCTGWNLYPAGRLEVETWVFAPPPKF
jgi:hypothetical protein